MDWRELSGIRAGLREAEKYHRELLERDAELFQTTQPGAIRYDQDKVQTSGGGDRLAAYIERKDAEQLDERIAIARQQVEQWFVAYDHGLRQLRRSRDPEDRIYCLRVIDCLSVRKVARLVGYSKSQVYNILKRMERLDKVGHFLR